MATFLSSVLAAALSQAPGGAPPPTAPDAIAAAQARVARGSADGRAWLELGRAYLTAFEEAQPRRARPDSSTSRAALDGAEQALTRAAALLGPAGASAEGDSARVLRVAGWSGRARLAVDGGGVRAGADVAGPEQGDRVPSGDFVFAALKLALDAHEAWAQAVLLVYGRAARLTPTLCETLATYGITGDTVGCGT